MVTNKAKIIRCLLQHPIQSTWDITECAGQSKRGLGRARDSLSRELIALERSGYIEEIKNPGDTGQGRKKHYQIKRDFTAIITLYNQKEYFGIRNEFRKSAWLTNLILDNHLQIGGGEPIKSDFTKMFAQSPLFFEFCLNPNFNNKYFARLVELFDTDLSNKRDITGMFDSGYKDRIPNYVIYDIFLLFCFREKLETIFQPGTDDPLIKFMGEIKMKSLEEKKRIRDYNSTVDFMTAIMAFFHYVGANNGSIPWELGEIIGVYYHDLDHYKRIKDNPDFKDNVRAEKRKLAHHYEGIEQILKLGIKRVEKEEV